jgi:hypothetical protein
MNLPCDYPTAIAFLDETGAIANDRFFAVGCLKLAEPSILVRGLQRLRDQAHWYQELHFFTVTRGVLPLCMKAVELVASTVDARFSCFVTDRELVRARPRPGWPVMFGTVIK